MASQGIFQLYTVVLGFFWKSGPSAGRLAFVTVGHPRLNVCSTNAGHWNLLCEHRLLHFFNEKYFTQACYCM